MGSVVWAHDDDVDEGGSEPGGAVFIEESRRQSRERSVFVSFSCSSLLSFFSLFSGF